MELSNQKIEELVEKIKKGDHAAFSELYDHFILKIYKYVSFKVKDSEVEDIVEDVFVRVWEKINKYKKQKGINFSAWIYRIAHNLIVDYYRKNKIDVVSDENLILEDDDKLKSPKYHAENELNREILQKAMEGLNQEMQDIIIYRFINGLENSEIAALLGKPEGTIRVMQFRAIKALKVNLNDIGFSY